MSEQKTIKAKPVFYAFCYEPLKEIARDMGYNLLINGSLNRDLDLVAIPWSDNPEKEVNVVIAFDKYLRGVHYDADSAESGYLHKVLPGGRNSYVISLNRGGKWNNYLDEQWYLDISFTPQVQPAPTCCARWVKALQEIADPIKFIRDRLQDGEQLNGLFAIQLSNDANYLRGIAEKALKDESTCTIYAGWMPGTPPLDKPCVFVSKYGSDYSVWQVIERNIGYLAICDGDGNEWGDISDFRCDSYYMLSPSTFPTREQAEEWADKKNRRRYNGK